jgi:hypothetical protein
VNAENKTPEKGLIQAPSGESPLTVLYAKTTLTMHLVDADQLEMIASLGNSIHLTFFGICVGAAVSLGGVLASTTIGDPKVFAGMLSCFSGSCLLGVYFGIRGVRDHLRSQRKLRQLLARPVVE